MKALPSLFFFLAAAALQANWQRLPITERMAINLASSAISGTSIASSHGMTGAESLLSEDATQATTLPRGQSEAVIRLGSHQILESIRFLNDGIEGSVTFQASADGDNWTPLDQAAIKAAWRTVELRFAGTFAKYLKMEFSLVRGGSLRTFKIYGLAHDTDYAVVPQGGTAGKPGENQRLDVNWASGLGQARPIYAWPTPLNLGTPNFGENLYQFPRSQEKHCTIIYDLGEMRDIQRFSTAYSKRPARLKIYAFSNLPEARDWRGKLSLDPAIFDMLEPVATGNDPEGTGHMKHEPGKAVSARFIALRFEPGVPVAPGHRTSCNPIGLRTPFMLSSLIPVDRSACFGADLLPSLASTPLGFVLAKLNLFQAGRFIRMTGLPEPAAHAPGADTGVFEATIEMSEHGLGVVPDEPAAPGAQSSYFADTPASPFTPFNAGTNLPSAASHSAAIHTPAGTKPIPLRHLPNHGVISPATP